MKKKLIIIGASGHGKVVADVAMKMNRWERIAFLDDEPSLKTSLGFSVIGTSNEFYKYIKNCDIFVGIGNNETRRMVYEQLEVAGATVPVLIHPSAVIGEQVQIEKGTVVMAGSIINSSTKVGKGCIINTGATVDHDANIEDYVHISPGANLAGGVTVGKCSWLGIGSTVINNINIVPNCTVGAGGLVVKNLENPGIYVGVPVRGI